MLKKSTSFLGRLRLRLKLKLKKREVTASSLNPQT
jgi:hypothetical protein